jgi:D-alanyl-D-alanine carboxypeptidase (penicillin-binding protein 5/6)
MKIGELIKAPVDKGVMLGRVMIRLGDQVLADKELVALNAIDEGNLWNKLVDKVLLYFE